MTAADRVQAHSRDSRALVPIGKSPNKATCNHHRQHLPRTLVSLHWNCIAGFEPDRHEPRAPSIVPRPKFPRPFDFSPPNYATLPHPRRDAPPARPRHPILCDTGSDIIRLCLALQGAEVAVAVAVADVAAVDPLFPGPQPRRPPRPSKKSPFRPSTARPFPPTASLPSTSVANPTTTPSCAPSPTGYATR